MIVVGLLGGVASGKSLVARQFVRLGAELLDADRIGHEVLRQPEVKAMIRQVWGDRVFSADGEIDRPRLAEIVFAEGPEGAGALARLEAITHPAIGRLLEERLENLRKAGSTPLVVLDAAVMLKAGWNRFCDYLIFIDVPEEQRQRRAAEKGLELAQWRGREAAQAPLDQKRACADWVFDNAGSPEKTFEQVEKFWHSIFDKNAL